MILKRVPLNGSIGDSSFGESDFGVLTVRTVILKRVPGSINDLLFRGRNHQNRVLGVCYTIVAIGNPPLGNLEVGIN